MEVAADTRSAPRVPRAQLLLVLGGLTLIYAIGTAVIPRHSKLLHAWSDLGWLGMTIWAAIACWRARGRERVHRLAAIVLTVANLVWMAAMVVWSVDELILGTPSPFPTVADLGFVAYAPLYALGIFLLAGGSRSAALSLRHLADLGIALGTMVFCGIVIYYRPSVESGLPALDLTAALAYPVAYLSAMAFALLAFLQQRTPRRRRALTIHLAALTLQAFTYTLYGVEIMTRSYEAGHLLDPCWFGGLALCVWAAHEDRWAPSASGSGAPASTSTSDAVAPTTLLDAVLPAMAFAFPALVTIAFRDDLSQVPVVPLAGAGALFTVALALRGVAVLRLDRELRAEIQSRERELHRAQKMEAVGTLAGGLAHDFNNLLTGIMAGASVLRKVRDPARQSELLDMIDQSAVRAAEITRRLLALSRRRRNPVMAVVEVERVFRRADALLRSSLPASIRLTTGDVPEGLRFWGDEGEIEQALLNLGLNAAHAMPDGGKLELTVARERHLHEGQPRGSIVIRVRDEGCGIPEPNRARIFEPFFTTRHTGEGTGLGLAMVYAAAEAHGGTIQFESTVGRGTTFELVLPETDRNGPLLAVTGEPDWLQPARGKETVLVVDDRDAPLLAAKVILESCGYRVLLATLGSEALSLWKQHPEIALVLTDSDMPEIQGVELLGVLRRAGFTGPAILMTGYDEDPATAATTFDGTLEKPFGASPLAQVVRRVLDERDSKLSSRVG